MSRVQARSQEKVFIILAERAAFARAKSGEGGKGGGGYGSEGIVPQKIFDNFIPKIAGNAPKFYN